MMTLVCSKTCHNWNQISLFLQSALQRLCSGLVARAQASRFLDSSSVLSQFVRDLWPAKLHRGKSFRDTRDPLHICHHPLHCFQYSATNPIPYICHVNIYPFERCENVFGDAFSYCWNS